MEVPVGFLAKLWSFISFLPFFLLLFVLGSFKGMIICPIMVLIITVGNSSVAIGMWAAHFILTYYCVMKSRRLGWVLKSVVVLALPVPLILWPILAIIGSLLGGLGYGFFTPLIATFEAVGQNVRDKLYHCFADGCLSAIKGSCTAVRDFTDFCFHSYFSYMDELCEEIHEDEKPMDIKISKLPSSLLVSVLAIPVDVPFISAIALWKSPYMLIKGWKRLMEDLIGREGPFLETVCVPFAGLAILLWPLAVVGSVIAAFLSSFILALYGGVIVHQMGLAYILAVISMFDEYTNDLLYLREGSCFPRNANSSDSVKERKLIDQKHEGEGTSTSKLVSEGSRTLKEAIQHYTPMQVWNWLCNSCEVNGRILLHEGLIDAEDIEKCIVTGNCKKLVVKLPAWTILQCLLSSAKSVSPGLEQIKGLQLREDEEICLRRLIIANEHERPEEWDNTGFPFSDQVRREQLQAVMRLQGIVGFMSRIPTFRRRFRNLAKVLYLEALQAGILVNNVAGTSKTRQHKKNHRGRWRRKPDEIEQTVQSAENNV